MVRFSVKCVLPLSQHVFWQVRDTYTFMRFLMTDGILKHISAGDEQVDAEGWATRRSEYCPVNVDCPDFVRRVVGDTMFELSDEQRWNDSVRPYHLTFIIRPSFLTKISNTRGELEVRPFPPDKQPQLQQPIPESQSVEPTISLPESDVVHAQSNEQQSRDPCSYEKEPDTRQIPESGINPDTEPELGSNGENELDKNHLFEEKHGQENQKSRNNDHGLGHGHEGIDEPELKDESNISSESSSGEEALLASSEPSAVVHVIDDGAVSPCSEYTSFEDLDELLDDSPLLPEVSDKPTPSVTSAQSQPPLPIDDVASEIDSSVSTDIGDGSTDNGEGECDDERQGDEHNDADTSNSSSTDKDHKVFQDEKREGEYEASIDKNRPINDCANDGISGDDKICEETSQENGVIDAETYSLDWQDDGESGDKNLDVTAEIDRLPVEEKCLLEVSGRTSVRIITIGWFVERTIVHNTRQFYGDYPATLLRFRRMLYRRFAKGDFSVPISVVVDRLLEWERINKKYLEEELDQMCNERSSSASHDRRKNIRPQEESPETNLSPHENPRQSVSIATNSNTDSQLEKPGPVAVSV